MKIENIGAIIPKSKPKNMQKLHQDLLDKAIVSNLDKFATGEMDAMIFTTFTTQAKPTFAQKIQKFIGKIFNK